MFTVMPDWFGRGVTSLLYGDPVLYFSTHQLMPKTSGRLPWPPPLGYPRGTIN